MLCGNLNVRQAMAQQVFKVTAICVDTRFQSFSPLINRIVHHDVLKFSTYLNNPLTQLILIVNLVIGIHASASYLRCSNQQDVGQHC